jgi:hypothetical protein
MDAYVPKPINSNAKAEGRFGKDDFVYDAASNEYRCPAGSRAIWRFAGIERNLKINRYWSSDCPRCSIKKDCTPSDYRRISRWEHEAVMDAVQQRLEHMNRLGFPRHIAAASPWIRLWLEVPTGHSARISGLRQLTNILRPLAATDPNGRCGQSL